jgi:hypothetical protein
MPETETYLNLEGSQGSRICEEILKLDSGIIFASFGSFAGFEIAFAESPAMTLLVGRNPTLKQKYCSIVASVVNSVKQAEPLMGKASTIIVNFQKNLRLIVLPVYFQEVFVFLITNREAESRTLAFSVVKLLQKFEKSLPK